jgi:predicted PilT family ATPase
MVFLYVTRALSEKPKMDSTVLDSQLFVPSSSVGHIIGKRGHRVRNTEARTDVKIYVLNAPQPPPSPSGSSRSRVKITGNFWNTQVLLKAGE